MSTPKQTTSDFSTPGYVTNTMPWHTNLGADLGSTDQIDGVGWKEKSKENGKATMADCKSPSNRKILYLVLLVAGLFIVNIVVVVITVTNVNSRIADVTERTSKSENKIKDFVDTIEEDEDKLKKNINETARKLAKQYNVLQLLNETIGITGKFVFVGFGYGRNSEGRLDTGCEAGGLSRLDCLLFCYRCKGRYGTVNGVHFSPSDKTCTCEKNTVYNKTLWDDDEHFDHYMLRDN